MIQAAFNIPIKERGNLFQASEVLDKVQSFVATVKGTTSTILGKKIS